MGRRKQGCQMDAVSRLQAFREDWSLLRALSLDLLADLSPAELEYTPGPGLGRFWKQFRHLGGVQECYLEALSTGRVDFSYTGRHYRGGPDRAALLGYLRGLDEQMFATLARADWARTVVWGPGDTPDLDGHLRRLVEHEVLHHGEWVVYVRLLGRAFPASWGLWGLA